MKYTVESSGFAFNGETAFVVDEEGVVMAEVYGRTVEEAKRKAALVAAALEADNA